MSDLPSGRPLCPNHKVGLIDLPVPLTPKGIGVCPISSCEFEYEVEVNEKKLVMNKDGSVHAEIKWTATGEEK